MFFVIFLRYDHLLKLWKLRKIAPPNQTANLCIRCVITLTFMSLTVAFGLAFLVASILPFVSLLISFCSRRPKSLNIVEPPDKQILRYNRRRLSIGDSVIHESTKSGRGTVCSSLNISGLKKSSGPKNRS